MEPIILPRISDQKPLVSVVSITYNHEPYIRDCLEGFLMQKTNFPVEIIIHDDASTDHTADIIREYYEKRPDLFHVIIERENLYSQHKPIMRPLCDQAKGKYIALCEGDDYWTDPLKIQKQVEMFRNNPKLAMVYTDYNIQDEISKHYISSVIENNTLESVRVKARALALDDIIAGECRISTASCMCKKEIFIKPVFPYQERKGLSLGDLFYKIDSAIYGAIGYIPEPMITYRMVKGSATHTFNPQKAMKFEWDALKIRMFYYKSYAQSEETNRRIIELAVRRMSRIALSFYCPESVRDICNIVKENKITLSHEQKICLLLGKDYFIGGIVRILIRLLKTIREAVRCLKKDKRNP